MDSEKEIKQNIRRLKKFKRDTQKYTEERRDINKKIRGLQATLNKPAETDPEQKRVIKEIQEIDRRRGTTRLCDLRGYSVEKLKIHLERLK